MLKQFSELTEQVKQEKRKTVAVAMAEDKDVLQALENARQMGITNALLTGSRKKIGSLMSELDIDIQQYKIVEAGSESEAVKLAVNAIHDGSAQVLMKGLCSTSVFLKGILDKHNGLRSGKVLSHLALFESPHYHKLFMMSDAAMNIAPDLSAKVAITENAIKTAHALGYELPKVAIISAVEKVNPEAMPSSGDAALIAKMGDRKQIKGAIIDGPLAVDNALSSFACDVKGLETAVGGDADILIVPNIETGNAFYKLLTILGGARVAGIIVGAAVPVVLTSRADSDESKLYSIITALKVG